jgi:hypothetical protein
MEIAQRFEQVQLVQHGALTVQDMLQANRLDNVALLQEFLLEVQDMVQSTELDNVTLSGVGLPLVVQDLAQAQRIEGDIPLTQHHSLLVDDLTIGQTLDVVSLGGVVQGSIDGCLVVIAKVDGCLVVL